jgi:hypothetical protein
MIYRKSSPTSPTLLLRIVAGAGASALLAAAACSGTDPAPLGGLGPGNGVQGAGGGVADSGEERSEGVMGVVPNPNPPGTPNPNPPSGGDSGMPSPCNGGPCGTIIMLPGHDAGVLGIVVVPPAEDASVPDGHVGGGVVVGVVPIPPSDAATSDAARHCCIGVLPIPEGGVGGGVIPRPDAGAHGPCNGLPCGVLIHPDGG